MKYKWDATDIKKALDKLKIIINKTTDVEERYYYSRVYDATMQTLFMFTTNFEKKDPPLNEKLCKLTNTLYSSGSWYSLVREVYDRVEIVDDFTYDATEAINKKVRKDKSFTLDTGSYIGHDQVIEMAKSFYERFDPELFEYFMYIYKHRYSSFDFVQPDGVYTSDCFFVDGVRRFFINIVDNNGVKKYTDTIHECGHIIESLMNPRICFDNNDNYFSEVSSIFPELVAFEEGFKTDKKDEYLYQYFCSLAATIDETACLIEHDAIAAAWLDNNCIVDSNYYDILKNSYNVDKKDALEALNVGIDSTGCYVTSMGIALELLHIYKQDKKEALKLFKKILMVPCDYNLNAYIMKLVPYGTGINKELKIFKDEFGSLLERKGVKL